MIAISLASSANVLSQDMQGIESELRAKASEAHGCSEEHPCKMEFKKIDEQYSIRVVKAVAIENDVPKYLPSATYYLFNENGQLLDKIHTP